MSDQKERLSLLIAGFANLVRGKGTLVTGDGQQSTYLTTEGASDGDVLTIDSSKPEGIGWGPGGGGSSDRKVKVASEDTTAGFLNDKLVEGNGVTFTVLNPGGNEQIQIDATGTASASWDIDVPGYFALDEDNGDDANDGFGLSGAAAVANAVASVARLQEVIPPVGNGRRVVILIVPRAGGATYSEVLSLYGKHGYQFKLIRGTLDGANDANERIVCGGINAAVGPGADGKWTVGTGVDAITFTIGGGALPAANSLNGYRIRFAFDTTTVALRGQCSRVWSHTAGGGATIIISEWVGGGTVPAAGDTFFIDRPGAIFPNVELDGSSDQTGTPGNDIGWVVAGLDSQEPGHGGCVCIGGYAVFSFMAVGGTYFRDLAGCVIQTSYYTEDDAIIPVGVGMRCTGDYQFFNIKTFVAISCDFQSTGNTHGFFNIDRYRIGLESSKFAQVPRLISCGYGPMRVPDQQWCQFGNNSHGGPIKLTAITGPSADIAKGLCYGSNIHMQHVECTNLGADGLIFVNRGGAITFEEVVGTTGNTGIGVDLRRCQGVTIRNEGSCSLSGNNSQMRLPGDPGFTGDPATDAGVDIKWTDLLKVGFIDAAGNNVGSNFSKIVGVGTVAKNKGVFQIIVGMALYYDGSADYVMARTDSSAEASCLFHGVALNTTDDLGTANQSMYVLAPAAGHAYIKNTGEALTRGALGYLTNTPGIIGKDPPPIGEFKLRIGYFSDGVSGTSGHMTINAELIPVAADGLA